MWQLVKGDEECLEGKVLVYGECSALRAQALNREDYSFGFYGSDELADFRERFPSDHEGAKKLIKEAESEMKNKPRASLFIQDEIQVTDSLLEAKIDVVYVGEWHDEESCKKAVQLGLGLYKLKWRDQKKKELSFGPESYKQVELSILEVHLWNNFITPLFEAFVSKEDDKYDDLKDRFYMFMSDEEFKYSAYKRDIKSILEIIPGVNDDNKSASFELVKAHVRRIVAVAGENYADAAKLTKKISQFTG